MEPHDNALRYLHIILHFPEDGSNMAPRNPGTYTREHTAQHHHCCETLRSDLYAHFRRTCLPNASHGLTSWIPLKQNISKANPALYNTGWKKYIYKLTNCSVRRPSAPVFGRRRGAEIGIKPSPNEHLWKSFNTSYLDRSTI